MLSALAIDTGAALAAEPVAARTSADIIVLTSPGLRAPKLDRQTLRAIFLMRVRQWPDGTPVRVFVLPGDSAVHDRFVRELLGTYPYVLERTWERLVFTGTGFAPEIVRSEQEMRQKIQGTRGAIGYAVASPADQHRTESGDDSNGKH
jgi:ABC-type phosphate transport system substrate-binding protein